MTATLAAMLVERGVIGWNTRIKEVFPDMRVHAGYEPVTLKQLLSHTAGFPAFANPNDEDEELVRLLEINTGKPMAERFELVLPEVLRRAPRAPAGQFAYSNMGYIVAGAVLEQLTKTPFETLLQRKVFAPLGITSAGFGVAGTLGKLDEPYGHSPAPIEPGPEADNSPLLSPAGTVHMSITNFAKHAAFHLNGEPRLINPSTLELLHTPVKDTYALGWGVVESDWASGRLLTHAGSNGRSFALQLLAPALGFAAVIACNSGTERGPEVINETLQAIKHTFLNVN